MKNYFKDSSFNITCPKCNNSIEVSFNSVGQSIYCTFCNQVITLKDNGFSDGLNKANRLLNNFQKRFK